MEFTLIAASNIQTTLATKTRSITAQYSALLVSRHLLNTGTIVLSEAFVPDLICNSVTLYMYWNFLRGIDRNILQAAFESFSIRDCVCVAAEMMKMLTELIVWESRRFPVILVIFIDHLKNVVKWTEFLVLVGFISTDSTMRFRVSKFLGSCPASLNLFPRERSKGRLFSDAGI